MFAIQDFCERHQDRNTLVGTDESCKWDQPRKKSEPSKTSEFNYGKQKSEKELNYTPVSKNKSQVSQRLLEKSILQLCKGTDALMLHCIEPLSDDSDTETNFETEPQLFTSMLRELKQDKITDANEIFKTLVDKHSEEYITKVENRTVGQSENEMWFEHRKGRITASISHSVLKCNMNVLKPNNYIVRSVMGTAIPFSSAATEYGQNMEKVALTQYLEIMKDGHDKFLYEDSGLFVSKSSPYLAASPDGKIKCICCGPGLVEVKCTFTHRHKTPVEIASDNNYNISLEGDKIKLKTNTSWYTQIQTQLGVCQMKYCDFVFFTLKDISIERIYFDEELFKMVKEKSEVFFRRFLISNV